MSRSIERFVEECRALALVRPAITEAHIEIIETGLTRCFRATAVPKYLRLWTDVERCISQTDRAVKERLEEIGRIADAFQEQERRSAPSPDAARAAGYAA